MTSARAILLMTLVAGLGFSPLRSQQVFDPFAGSPPPRQGLTDTGDLVDLAPPPTPEPPSFSARKLIGFTWWNDEPEMVRRGNEAYDAGDFPEAEIWFRDAGVTRKGRGIPEFNEALALARQKKFSEARPRFDAALLQAGQDPELRADIFYNRGTAEYQRIREEWVKLDAARQSGQLTDQRKMAKYENARETLARELVSVIADFNRVLERQPANEPALFNKSQAQHLLERMSPPPDPPQEQQQQQNQSGDGQQEQQQQQQSEQGDQEQQQQQNQQNQEQQDEQQGQDQQQNAGQEESEEDQQSGSQADGQPQPSQVRPMTPEEADQLLQLLGDQQNVRIRKRTPPSQRPEVEKIW
jgi:hypothetical protein